MLREIYGNTLNIFWHTSQLLSKYFNEGPTISLLNYKRSLSLRCKAMQKVLERMLILNRAEDTKTWLSFIAHDQLAPITVQSSQSILDQS